MKRILTSLLVAVGITGPCVSNLNAQNHPMLADVPFAFVANNKTMPAGQYDLSQSSGDGSVFRLRDARGHASFAMLSSRAEGKPSTVTFACYGHDCVLATIRPPGSETTFAVGRDSIEKHLHHTLGVASMVSVKLTLH